MTLKVSVIVSSFNRAPLLDRSLATYAKQTLDPRYWEFVLVDDGSTDETKAVAKKWANAGVPIRVLDARDDLFCPKRPGIWRDGSAPRNAGSTHCFGEVLISTHPEIMIPPDALEIAFEAVRERPRMWHTAIPYWLSRPVPDDLSWEEHLSVLERLHGFFAPDEAGADSLPRGNRLQSHRRDWEEDSWFAIDMGLWRRIGGLREFADWGLANADFANRRQAIGIPTNVLTSETSRAPSGSLMVYHQWHLSPRETPGALDRVRELAPRYADAAEALHAGALRGLYWSGHREREEAERAVLGDHIDRYQFAASFCQGNASVLDVPCGTGYGSALLGEPFRYVGLDIDAESIRWARQRYQRSGVEFYQGSMARMAFPDASFDVVICFEGLEHLAEQQAFVAHVHRILKPGGWFIVSTPHKGKAPGTQFDRYMLGGAELRELVTGTGFIDLSWYWQGHYGGVPGTNPVMRGFLPEANIMILSSRKPAPQNRAPPTPKVLQSCHMNGRNLPFLPPADTTKLDLAVGRRRNAESPDKDAQCFDALTSRLVESDHDGAPGEICMFTDKEREYLRMQQLARLATIDPTGQPDADVVSFELDCDDILIGSYRNLEGSRKYMNVAAGGEKVSLVVDSLGANGPMDLIAVKLHGIATIEHRNGRFGPAEYLVVRPMTSWSWGVEGPAFVNDEFQVRKTIWR